MKTTLVRRPPFIDLEPMDRWVNTMLSGMGFGSLVRTYLPAADVYVSDGSYVVELETPGFLETELSVEIEGRMLTINGTHEETSDEHEKSFRIHERLANEFVRTFMIPPEVELDSLTSSFANGVLRIVAPLPGEVAPRKIPIRTSRFMGRLSI